MNSVKEMNPLCMLTSLFFLATPLFSEILESSPTRLTLMAMIHTLCHAVDYFITVTIGVQTVSSGACDTSNGVTRRRRAITGSVYIFTVENQELSLKPDQIYCYKVALTAAGSNNAKVHGKFFGYYQQFQKYIRGPFLK